MKNPDVRVALRRRRIGVLALVLSGCGASQSVTPPASPNATSFTMSITNGTKSVIVMVPQTRDRSCMKRVPPHVSLAPKARWSGTIALDSSCPANRWSFGIAFDASFPAGVAEWTKSGDGHWLILLLTSELELRPQKGADSTFNIRLVKGQPPKH